MLQAAAAAELVLIREMAEVVDKEHNDLAVQVPLVDQS
jgi:hypothetical protein